MVALYSTKVTKDNVEATHNIAHITLPNPPFRPDGLPGFTLYYVSLHTMGIREEGKVTRMQDPTLPYTRVFRAYYGDKFIVYYHDHRVPVILTVQEGGPLYDPWVYNLVHLGGRDVMEDGGYGAATCTTSHATWHCATGWGR